MRGGSKISFTWTLKALPAQWPDNLQENTVRVFFEQHQNKQRKHALSFIVCSAV